MFIQQMTGINHKMVEAPPIFEEIKNPVREMIEDAIFVAHNARCDYSFIQGEFKRHNDTYRSKILCTVRLSRVLYSTTESTINLVSSLGSRSKLPTATGRSTTHAQFGSFIKKQNLMWGMRNLLKG